jgi:1-aminocyclopropane-1-carboxylate deaminase/D-cysteine desulfhydrase-like pyridoxal-dependent ACC family enzyme
MMAISLEPALRGSYPTPVEHVAALSTEKCALWVKRDDLTHPVYGGNKVRKLERLLADARGRGKKRLLTVGAAGSHHVLATAIFGRAAGFAVDAVLVPQRRTAHVETNLRADLAQGLAAHPARTYVGAALAMAMRWGPDAYVIPMGGSNVAGSLGYVDAARELDAQVKSGALPAPDVIIVTVGSGGTAAGLCAGLALTELNTRVLGVMVAPPAPIVGGLVRWLTRRCHRLSGGERPRDALARLDLTTKYMGAGYGEPTEAGMRAQKLAATLGLSLDPTYTAKAFAAVLDEIASGRYRTILYWHTLSSAPMGPLLAGAPVLPDRLARLCR